MKKFNINGYFSVFADFLQDLEGHGENEDYIVDLYGGAYGTVTLIEYANMVIGYAEDPKFDRSWVAKGKIIGNNCFQLYLCGNSGKVYTLSVDGGREDTNCAVFYCKYNKDLTFDELISAYTHAYIIEEEIDLQEYLKIEQKFNNLYKRSSNLYKTHVTGFLNSEYVLLEDFGAFSDMLDYDGIKDMRCNNFIPIYEICAECVDRLEEYVESLQLKPDQSYEIPNDLLTDWVTEAIERRNLGLNTNYYNKLTKSIVDAFEKDEMDSCSLTLCTAKLILDDPILQEYATISPERLYGYCIYDNIDNVEELDDTINSFKIAHDEKTDQVIYDVFKGKLEDQQVSTLMDCFNSLESYYNTIGGDYNALLDFIKDETLNEFEEAEKDLEISSKPFVAKDEDSDESDDDYFCCESEPDFVN